MQCQAFSTGINLASLAMPIRGRHTPHPRSDIKLPKFNDLFILENGSAKMVAVCGGIFQDEIGIHIEAIVSHSDEWTWGVGECYCVPTISDSYLAEVESARLGEVQVVRFLTIERPRRIGFHT